MKPSTALTKTCSSCGQQKPLSAFLQLSEAQGAIYGNVCAACRKTNAAPLLKPKDIEGSGRSSTGVGINSKTKVKDAQTKRNRFIQIEEEFFAEREEKGEKQVQQTEKRIDIAKKEQKHRESYQPSFLDKNKSKPSSGERIFGSTKQIAEAGKIDLAAGPVDYTRVSTLKTQSSIFLTFKQWLGNAPIVSAAEQAVKKVKQNAPKEKVEPDKLNERIANRMKPK